MIAAKPTPDESHRLDVLRKYSVLDTPPEQALDDLTALAAQICEAPVAMISLVDADRQWFKATAGTGMAETPRDISFCGHTIQQQDLFIVPDATHDPRFSDNPLVMGDPHICFYAGAPLVSPESAVLGSLCVIDHVPRQLTTGQEKSLRVLARQVMTHLELRRKMRELADSKERLRLSMENAVDAFFLHDPAGNFLDVNRRACESLGYSREELLKMNVSEVSSLSAEEVKSVWDQLQAGSTLTVNDHHRRKDGTRFPIEIRLGSFELDGERFYQGLARDITERRHAEEVLHGELSRESGRQRRGVFLDLAIIFILSTIVFTIGHVYDVFDPIFLYFAYRNNQLNSDLDEVVATMAFFGLAMLVFSYRRLMDSRAEVLTQTQISNALGILHAEMEATVRQRTAELVHTNEDLRKEIVERRRVEAIIRQFPAIVETSDDAIVSKTLDGIITSWNPAAARMFGYTASETIGKPITLLFPPDRLQEEKDILARIARGERVQHHETVRVRKDGRQLEVSATISPIKDAKGEITGVSKIVRDITERKQAQEQIAEQAALLDKARDAIIVRNVEGKILFWNHGAERMYGWTADHAIGRNVRELFYADPKKFEEINGLTLTKGEWNGELQHQTKDRGEITVEARWTLIRDNEGRPKSVLAINTDITERKKIEAQFLRAQRMESIGTLAGGVAHDLNNILAPIMMSIEILKATSTDPQAALILDAIEVSAQRGSDIVRQVLSFARGMEGERIEVQPKHLLKDLENIVRDTFPKDIRLRFSIPNDIWMILGDPTQVHQILLNLCVNARDAMPNGGSLTIGVENCMLDEQYAAMNIQAKPGRYVIISVTDTGTGIPPAILEKIFEPFFTTKDLTKGTGLGLSTVMAIIKSHDGFVNVYSEPGKGTTFKVYLPALETSSEGRRQQAEAVTLPRGNGEAVLVVDDEASILTITSQTLQAFGYRVFTATDGAEAVAVYLEHRHEIAVVLTDMMMPVMDGPAAIHALMRVNPAVKIIAASGLSSNGGVATTPGAGIKHFLTKPYTAGTLLKAIRTILDEA